MPSGARWLGPTDEEPGQHVLGEVFCPDCVRDHWSSPVVGTEGKAGYPRLARHLPFTFMGTALQVMRSIAGGLLIIFGLVVFGRDSAARMREGKLMNPRWIGFVAMKNETPGWGFWVGLASAVVGVLLLPL